MKLEQISLIEKIKQLEVLKTETKNIIKQNSEFRNNYNEVKVGFFIKKRSEGEFSYDVNSGL